MPPTMAKRSRGGLGGMLGRAADLFASAKGGATNGADDEEVGEYEATRRTYAGQVISADRTSAR